MVKKNNSKSHFLIRIQPQLEVAWVSAYVAPVLVNPSNPQFDVTDAELLRPDHLNEDDVDQQFSGNEELSTPRRKDYAREYDLFWDANEAYNDGRVTMATASRVVSAEVEG